MMPIHVCTHTQGTVVDCSAYRLPVGVPHKCDKPLEWYDNDQLFGSRVYMLS